MGYVQWRRFDGLVGRARHLIANGEAMGMIKCTTMRVAIGSGAIRRVRDYLLDERAVELVTKLSSSVKLNGYYHIRNECVILGLLKKYCTARHIHFEFQKRCGTAVFDAVIGRRIAIEFDEPHHAQDVEQRTRDKAKDAIANDFGLTVLRFTIVHDIVDVILAVEAEFKTLSGAAQHASVHDALFGVFHDAVYKGIYDGLGRDAIRARKRIEPREQLMDRMNATELAANQFRMTQTRDKLARERIQNQSHVIQTHEQVGKEVRDAIKRIGGTLPENIAPAEHIKEVEKRLKTATPKLELDDHDASGLLGGAREKPKSE
ncbi:MAG: hypothetical protein ABI619_06765 [Betaproteobacteria bacterium]